MLIALFGDRYPARSDRQPTKRPSCRTCDHFSDNVLQPDIFINSSTLFVHKDMLPRTHKNIPAMLNR